MKIRLNPNRHRSGWVVAVGLAVLVLAVGAIMVWKLWQWASKIPPVNPPTQTSGTNDPDSYILLTNGMSVAQMSALIADYLATNPPVQGFTGESPGSPCTFTMGYACDVNGLRFIGASQYGSMVHDPRLTFTVTVERSTNLVNWESVITNSVPCGEVVLFQDSTAPCQGAFYRLRR